MANCIHIWEASNFGDAEEKCILCGSRRTDVEMIAKLREQLAGRNDLLRMYVQTHPCEHSWCICPEEAVEAALSGSRSSKRANLPAGGNPPGANPQEVKAGEERQAPPTRPDEARCVYVYPGNHKRCNRKEYEHGTPFANRTADWHRFVAPGGPVGAG